MLKEAQDTILTDAAETLKQKLHKDNKRGTAVRHTIMNCMDEDHGKHLIVCDPRFIQPTVFMSMAKALKPSHIDFVQVQTDNTATKMLVLVPQESEATLKMAYFGKPNSYRRLLLLDLFNSNGHHPLVNHGW